MKGNDVNPVSVDWLKVESAVVAFEDAYRLAGVASIAAHCPPPDHPLHLPIARELIRADLEFAWAAGIPRLVDDYRAEFPALFADPDSLRQVAFEEYRLRLQADESTSPAEYAARYGIDVSGWTSGEKSRTDPVIVLPMTDVLSAPDDDPVRPFTRSPSRTAAAESDRFPEPGETYLGFRLVRELGRGAFARVYLAEQDELAGRSVALKVSADLPAEAQTLARLQHTNIVPIYSTHRAGKYHAVCMPYFGGTTLADVLQQLRGQPELPLSGNGFYSTVNQRKDDTQVSPAPADALAEPPPAPTPLEALRGMTHAEAVLWVGAELADGLAHAHDRGILHRDLKPANVLIADDGRPMLLDFNLAADTRERPAHTVGGTPYYMSPEQLDAMRTGSMPIDARSDVYSLGLMLYELLTGRLTAATLTGSLWARVTALRTERAHPFPPARRLNSAVTPAADAILAKCLHPDPNRRYPSAHQLRDDLRRQLENLPLKHTREPSVRERARKFVRRNPWVKSVAFLGAVLAVVVTAAGMVTVKLIAQRDAATTAVAERDFLNTASELRVALQTPTDARRKRQQIDRGRDTLTRYGLPGGDPAVNPAVRLAPTRTPELRGEVARLHLLLASAEAAGRTDDAFRRAEVWLGTLEATGPDRRHQRLVARMRELIRNDGKPATPADDDDDADGLLGLLARNQPRRLLELLDRRSPATLQPAHWVGKAQCHTVLAQFAEAAACYTTAAAVYGKPSASLSAGRGRTYLELRQYDRAVADFDAALTLEPDAADCLIDRALARLGRRQYRLAVTDLDRALELWPTHTRIYFIRAEAKVLAGDKAGAAKDRQLGLTTDPGDEPSWVSRGMTKLNAADPKGAVADFDAALTLYPKSRDARQNKAAALADHLNRTAEAVVVLDELIADHPDFLPARAGRGVYLARLGKRDAAHADAAEVLKRDPPAFFRYQLAGVYALTSKTHPADAQDAFRLLASAFQDRVGLEYVANDPDLGPISRNPLLLKLVEAARELASRERRK